MSRILRASEINNRGKKATETSVLRDLCANIVEERLTSLTGQAPHNFIKNTVSETKVVCPWMTYDKMMNFHRSQLTATLSIFEEPPGDTTIDAGSPSSSSSSSTPRKNAGRKLIHNNKRKRHQQQASIASLDEIAQIYEGEKRIAERTKKRMVKGWLKDIIRQVRNNNNLQEDIVINEGYIRQRLKRGSVFNNGVRGHSSPILPMEPTIVTTIVQMAQIRQCLAPSQGLALYNNMIAGTSSQEYLIKSKTNYSFEGKDVGKLGYGYWSAFKERNKHLLVSKRGHKY